MSRLILSTPHPGQVPILQQFCDEKLLDIQVELHTPMVAPAPSRDPSLDARNGALASAYEALPAYPPDVFIIGVATVATYEHVSDRIVSVVRLAPPEKPEDVRRILRLASDEDHAFFRVVSAATIIGPGRQSMIQTVFDGEFGLRRPTDREITAYIRSEKWAGMPFVCAPGYHGSDFVVAPQRDLFAATGLPLSTLYKGLESLGVDFRPIGTAVAHDALPLVSAVKDPSDFFSI